MGMTFVGGLPETKCGAGSMMSNTTNVRNELRGLLDELGVKVLLDAPCGDCNWIFHVDLSGIEYIGADNDDENLLSAINRMPSGTFMSLDILSRIPKADLMLCRDFLQHLPNEDVWKVLNNFCESGIEWLLATSHENESNEDLKRVGGFRPLNLLLEPFRLPPAIKSLQDGPGRLLSLWNASSILKRMSKAH